MHRNRNECNLSELYVVSRVKSHQNYLKRSVIRLRNALASFNLAHPVGLYAALQIHGR